MKALPNPIDINLFQKNLILSLNSEFQKIIEGELKIEVDLKKSNNSFSKNFDLYLEVDGKILVGLQINGLP